MKNSSSITLKNIALRQAAAFFTALLMLLAAGCSASPGGASSETSAGAVSSESSTDSEIQKNRSNCEVPLFSNEFDYSRGGDFPENGEDYLNYSAYKEQFFTYKDMKDHASAVSAARLAQMGVFEQTENFEPQGSITVLECVKKIFTAAEIKTDGKSDDDIISLAKSSGLVEEGVVTDFSKNITLPELAYLADRATPDRTETEQFAMYFSDYANVPDPLKNGVLQAFGLGIIESDGTLSPEKPATRAQAADVIYRLVNPGARVITPYELGKVYNDSDNEFLVRNTYVTNPGGIQLGVFSNYNHQDTTFGYFGKRTADRTDFYKWSGIEKTKGKYTMPNFANDHAAHRAGSTAIISVDMSANYNVAPSLSDGSRIPSFYTQDITDKTTRTAAKQFLYQFVSSMMSSLYGDVILAIDYELDFQQGLNGTTEQHRRKAEIFAEWYAEACNVAREAARSVGAADRLKLICIYNNITDLHKLGKNQNEWMLKIAESSDYIGIDSYQRDSNDISNPNLTIQNLRFLTNIAILLNKITRFKAFFRVVIILPFLIGSGNVMSQLLSMEVDKNVLLFSGSNISVWINSLMGGEIGGIIDLFFSVIVLVLWSSSVQILLFLSAIQSTNPALYEAARIDGAGEYSIFWKITLPTVMPILLLNTVYTIINTFTSSTNPLLYYIKKQSLSLGEHGYAAALGWIYFAFIIVFIGIVVLILNKCIKATYS